MGTTGSVYSALGAMGVGSMTWTRVTSTPIQWKGRQAILKVETTIPGIPDDTRVPTDQEVFDMLNHLVGV